MSQQYFLTKQEKDTIYRIISKVVNCSEYVQSPLLDGQLRNSCLLCGRTKESHISAQQVLPAHVRATDWLDKKGLQNAPYYELAKNILTQYIEDSGISPG